MENTLVIDGPCGRGLASPLKIMANTLMADNYKKNEFRLMHEE